MNWKTLNNMKITDMSAKWESGCHSVNVERPYFDQVFHQMHSNFERIERFSVADYIFFACCFNCSTVSQKIKFFVILTKKFTSSYNKFWIYSHLHCDKKVMTKIIICKKTHAPYFSVQSFMILRISIDEESFNTQDMLHNYIDTNVYYSFRKKLPQLRDICVV